MCFDVFSNIECYPIDLQYYLKKTITTVIDKLCSNIIDMLTTVIIVITLTTIIIVIGIV